MLQYKNLPFTTWFPSIWILIATVISYSSVPLAHGQTNAAISNFSEKMREDISHSVAKKYEKAALSTLSRYFPEDSFRIDTQITIDKFPKRLPYLSEAAYLRTISEQSIDNLSRYVASARLVVYLSNSISERSEEQIKSLLIKQLRLNDGDEVSFAQLTLEYDKKEAQAEREISRLQSDLQNTRSELDKLTRERNDAKTEMLTLKSTFEKELLEKKQLEKQINDLKKNFDGLNADSLTGQKSSSLQSAIEHPYFIVAILIAFVTAISGIFAIFFSFKNLSKSHGAVAKSLKSIGQALGSQRPAQEIKQIDKQETKQISAERSGQISSDASTVATLQARVIELHDKALSLLSEEKIPMVTSHVATLLQHEDTVEAGVATMELLGSQMANNIYASLGHKMQKAIRDFIALGYYKDGKALALYKAGEALMTILTMERICSNFKGHNPAISNLLSQLELGDLCKLTQTLSVEVLSRRFLYFEPALSGNIISYFEDEHPDHLAKHLEALALMAEYADDESLDRDIMDKLNDYITSIDSDKYRAFMAVYANVANKLSDDASNLLTQALAQKSKSVFNYLNLEVVNVSTFYRVQDEIKAEIISRLTNRQLAALLISINSKQHRIWMDLISERRIEAISEQREQLESQTNIKIKKEIDDAKGALRYIIVELKNSGQLSFKSDDHDQDSLLAGMNEAG